MSEHTDIVFNALSEQSIIIHKNATIPLNTEDADDIKIDTLKSFGIICDDNKDELTQATEIFLKTIEDKSNFRLTINPTLQCNFRCWYCYEQHNAASVMNDEVFEKLKQFIADIMDRYQSIELAFFGGEPLMEFDSIVLPLIEYTKDLCLKRGKTYLATFTTNGFLINPDIIKKLSIYDVGTSQITLDGGPDYHNKTRKAVNFDSFQRIVDNIKLLVKAGLQVLIRINATKENIHSALEIPHYFKDLNPQEKERINVSVQQVWQDIENNIFDGKWDIYEAFLNIGIRPWPISFDALRSICYADRRHSAVVNYDGRIFKCTAIDFNIKKEDSTLDHNIFASLDDAFEKRLVKRFSNPNCKKCRILPLCVGGCSKNIDQASGQEEYCLHSTDEDKDKMVRRIISEQLILKKLEIS
ncbi:MAG: radical SAM protein [Muribaculaceae bacterium]|nr:radical SAM protein [Muribaculaceae bacterium]